MLRSVLLTGLMSLTLSSPTVMAEDAPITAPNASLADKPADAETAKAAETSAAPAKVEIRDSAQFFDETLNNMKDELATAKADGKKGVLMMFEMDECPFCQRMKSTVLNRSDIQDYYKDNFRIVTVDIKGDVELTDFKGEVTTQKDFSLKEFRVRATPVFQFIGLDGEPVKNGRLTGATKDADEFMLFGKYVVDKKNEEIPFSKFKREQAGDTTTGDTAKADDAKS
ncbi:thioredoxin family protein [Thiothrix lacustris]|uniref:thioredoxin family protein n=1 Tax=Thiothrix lacustris TaxID=525917 RepID=UPI0027E45DA4|nr:thioredoxin family protein [Thiothrix lacustris]WMP17018.1 thioredoxin family protein [Thiothrix lacustris]